MDDFLINPTTGNMMDKFGNAYPAVPVTPPRELFPLEANKKDLESTISFKRFRDAAIYSPGYASEEELASPVDNDDFSFRSLDSDAESIASNDNGSYHVQTCTAQQLCSRAQAVHVVSAGKAKVVSMPKLTDSPSTQSPTSPARPITYWPAQSTVSGLTRTYINEDAPSSSPSLLTSGEQWPASPTPLIRYGRPEQPRTIRRRPNLSPLQMFPRSESPQEVNSVPKSNAFSKSVNFLNYEPAPAALSTVSLSPAVPSKRRVYRLPSTFSLRASWKSLKRHSGGSDGSSDEPAVSPQSSQKVQLHAIADMHIPTRTSSKALPKMVPRGANERAPPIVLPPCPYDAGDWDDDDESLKWPLRKDCSTKDSLTSSDPRNMEHGFEVARSRRKSLPAYVSAQV